jgi:hypothetical protein
MFGVYAQNNTVLHDDYATTFSTIPVKVNVLANDTIQTGCAPTLEIIAPFAKHGTATIN